MMRDQILDDLVNRLKKFADERDWEQFHSPKNLAMALSVEVAEILELFQWLTEEQTKNISPDKIEKVKEEIGDVQIYLVRLADQFGIDPLQAAEDKIKKNELKYPVNKSKGSAKKYTEL